MKLVEDFLQHDLSGFGGFDFKDQPAQNNNMKSKEDGNKLIEPGIGRFPAEFKRTEFIDDQQYPVHSAPNDEINGGTMPQSAECKGKQGTDHINPAIGADSKIGVFFHLPRYEISDG